jgi:hypothetical protein
MDIEKDEIINSKFENFQKIKLIETISDDIHYNIPNNVILDMDFSIKVVDKVTCSIISSVQQLNITKFENLSISIVSNDEDELGNHLFKIVSSQIIDGKRMKGKNNNSCDLKSVFIENEKLSEKYKGTEGPKYFGMGCSYLINLFNPDYLIIFGGIMDEEYSVKSLSYIKEYSNSLNFDGCKIVTGDYFKNQEYLISLGAAFSNFPDYNKFL